MQDGMLLNKEEIYLFSHDLETDTSHRFRMHKVELCRILEPFVVLPCAPKILTTNTSNYKVRNPLGVFEPKVTGDILLKISLVGSEFVIVEEIVFICRQT